MVFCCRVLVRIFVRSQTTTCRNNLGNFPGFRMVRPQPSLMMPTYRRLRAGHHPCPNACSYTHNQFKRPMPPQSSERTSPKKRHRGCNDFQEISTFQTEHPIEASSNRQDLLVEHHFETNGESESPFQPVSMEPSHYQRGVCSPPQYVARSFMGAYVRDSAAFLNVLAADITDQLDHLVNEGYDGDPSFYPPRAEQLCEDSLLETDAESLFSVD